ncbi:hypothetical protein LPJ66_004722 [Kickxella alabastrina]|uniref:Uncharacterized protein n=1 Tax=Kickxella alabastrina TaxID=61397 RepID=A0ACC1IH69_9FUNG|nr:hypothetical protein LPJ66_004722 [Kickxella alabastrina]
MAEEAELLVSKLTAALDDPRVTQIEFVPELPPLPPQQPSNDNSNDSVNYDYDSAGIITAYHPFLIGDGSLGIPFQAMPAALKFATRRLQNLTAGKNNFYGAAILPSDATQVCDLTLCILVFNADHHSAWNWR